MLVIFGLMLAVMYFVMILPQQRQLKQHRAMLAALKKDDEVITQGGMLGKIYAITDRLITLEVSPGVRIRILKSSIQGLAGGGGEEAKGEQKAKKEEK